MSTTNPTPPAWRKSTRSGSGNACVEVADTAAARVLVRDSKLGEASPVLRFSATQWRAFVAATTGMEIR